MVSTRHVRPLRHTNLQRCEGRFDWTSCRSAPTGPDVAHHSHILLVQNQHLPTLITDWLVVFIIDFGTSAGCRRLRLRFPIDGDTNTLRALPPNRHHATRNRGVCATCKTGIGATSIDLDSLQAPTQSRLRLRRQREKGTSQVPQPARRSKAGAFLQSSRTSKALQTPRPLRHFLIRHA